jgi:hypothetical protein
MTDTTPEAVERFTPDALAGGITPVMRPAISGKFVRHSDYAALSAQLEAAKQHADTPACDTKTAENVTQDALCKSNAAQEAAMVLLGDDYNSPLLEMLDKYNNDYDVGQDVLKALRAITGGKE